MNKLRFLALILTLIVPITFVLASCSDTSDDVTYTITWQNYDGTVLEVDTDILQGATPTYDGITPTKLGSGVSYLFSGWTPTVVPANGDATYTATFTEVNQPLPKYTVTWKNHDGAILETDNDVVSGNLPVYNGELPTKSSQNDVTYRFSGWSPEITLVSADVTYTATFIQVDPNGIAGVNPVFSADGKTIQYGFYPQTYVSDPSLVATLDTLQPSSVSGWYIHNGNYYAKATANTFNGEVYLFDDGKEIVNGTNYYFKCEPIVWNVLNASNGEYYLLSKKLLDSGAFYNSYSNRVIDDVTIYANNYAQSSIRSWLNNEFYSIAFALSSKNVIDKMVDNGGASSNFASNEYACANTTDKVYLPSYQDLLNVAYGFDANAQTKSSTRESKTTDYARATGAWCNTNNDLNATSVNNGSYWTRTPSSQYYYCAWNVNAGGYLSQYAVDGTSHSVRPCISITL